MHVPAGDGNDPVVPTDLTEAEQQVAVRKATLRLLPLLFICYIIAYIDRINVGFAKLHLQDALGVDPAVYNAVFGLGAGLFFIGYFIFEVPSNLILQRVGARIWIARIMIVWGLVSMGFMFLQGKTMFYVMRFLLGAAEAGFFPGVLLYFTYWFPAKERAKTIAWFAVGGVVSGVIGSPISGALLGMDGLMGFKGWQWLFFLEALPAIIFGVIVLWKLPNGPDDAKWLNDRERKWIKARVAVEGMGREAGHAHNLGAIFRSGHVWLCCLIYFLLNVGNYGFEMWLPTIVKGFSGQSDQMVGFINMIPYIAAGFVMVFVGRHSDRKGERRLHVAFSAAASALGYFIAATAKNPYVAMAGLVIAFSGSKSTLGPFWAMTTAFLGGAGAAGGIALINSVGNLGGFFGPYLIGMLKDYSTSNLAPLLLLAGAMLGMGLFTLLVPQKRTTDGIKSRT